MESRPYRSHKIRACDLCRKQKSRCIVDLPGQACHRCRTRGDDCVHRSKNSSRASRIAVVSPIPFTQRRIISGIAPEAHNHGAGTLVASRILPPSASPRPTTITQPSPGQQSTLSSLQGKSATRHVHILGPSGAQDSQFLEQHLAPDANSHAGEELIGIYSNDRRKPVGFASLLRSQENIVHDPVSSRVNRRQLMEQVLSPFAGVLRHLHIEKALPAFPIIHRRVLLEAITPGDISTPELSDALLCAVYSSALTYWKCSDVVSRFPCPDPQFAHGLTVGALQEEFTNARISTVVACLTFLNKRPIMSVMDNSMNVGRVVTLSHCLGLNRDSSTWNIPQGEKDLRTRLWWGVLIHDTWSSFARGIPAHVVSSQYDVPVPRPDNFADVDGDAPLEPAATDGFILLCELTLILREMMDIVFNLTSTAQENVAKRLRQHEVSLDGWEDSFLRWKTNNVPEGSDSIPGGSSLTLGFLSTKMLLYRIALHESTKADEPQFEVTRQYNQMNCRKAAHGMVEFVMGLKQTDFDDFWLPYAASHLTVCATLLVRCALETDEPNTANGCMDDLRQLQAALGNARDEHGWEVGETCIAHCEALISRIKHVSADPSNADADDGSLRQVFEFDVESGHGDLNLFDTSFWENGTFMNGMPWDPLNP